MRGVVHRGERVPLATTPPSQVRFRLTDSVHDHDHDPAPCCIVTTLVQEHHLTDLDSANGKIC